MHPICMTLFIWMRLLSGSTWKGSVGNRTLSYVSFLPTQFCISGLLVNTISKKASSFP